MAAITPSTNLKLLKNPNNLSSQNQLTFSNSTSQYNYFNSLTQLSVDDFTYQRKDYTIRYPACIDDILDYNYCMYQNEAYGDKWFYAYITNMRWLNDHVTEITIQTDVFQTFQFDITYKASFIEREHVTDDTVGKHTIPEGLETGDYICNTSDAFLFNDNVYMMQVSETPAGVKLYATNVNGIWMSGGFYASDNMSTMINIMNTYTKEGVIQNMYIIPRYLLAGQFDDLRFTGVNTPIFVSKTVSQQTSIDTYVPKNNKLFVYPYNYLLETNNNGASIVLKYELFSGTPSFSIGGCATVGGSIISIPTNYNEGLEPNMLIAGKFPTCSWAEDPYTNWLTMNGVNVLGTTLNAAQAGYIKGGMQILTGAGLAATGDLAGGAFMGMGARQIFDTMQENYQHSLIPESFKGNINGGDFLTASNKNGFYFYKMSIKKEMAQSIDNYFSMYGYKVNIVKVPNINTRVNWNYVKCIGANIEGLIPEFYLDEIKSLFNAGITLWHNPNTFLDYSQSNGNA